MEVLMQRWLLPIVTALLVGVLLWLVVWWLPLRLYPPLPAAEPNPTSVTTANPVQLENDRLKLQNDARGTLMQGLGGIVVVFGALFTWQQIRLTRLGQVTDSYTKAIDQLGHEQLAVRLGGIYALQRIARDSANDQATIAQVLCTYARTAKRESYPGKSLKSHTFEKRAPDVQAALTILVEWRRQVGGEVQWRDLHGGDYQGVNLERAHLPYSFFYDAELQDAQLRNTNLENADLSRAQLNGADLRGANLAGANLYEANLQGAKANSGTKWPEYWTDPARRREAGILEDNH
jgi:hypothetical protein